MITKIVNDYPWIHKPHNWLTSPDLDGIMSAIFLVNFFGGEIVGFYNGRVLVFAAGYIFSAVADCEIFNSKIPSIGNHMCVPLKEAREELESDLVNCINPNLLRNVYMNRSIKKNKNNFAYNNKYPFSTSIMLWAIAEKIIGKKIDLKIFSPVFFTDGMHNILSNYSYDKNCKDWIIFFNNDSIKKFILKHMHEVTTRTKIKNNNSIFFEKEINGKAYNSLIKNIKKIQIKKNHKIEYPDWVFYMKDLESLLIYLHKEMNLYFDKQKWPILYNKIETKEFFHGEFNKVTQKKMIKIYEDSRLFSANLSQGSSFQYTLAPEHGWQP